MKKKPRVWIGRPLGPWTYHSVIACPERPSWSRTGYLQHPTIGMGSAITVCGGFVLAVGIHLRKGHIVELKVTEVKA